MWNASKYYLLAGTMLAGAVISGSALAQEAAPAAKQAGLQDIVVTAQRRTQSTQKTSLTIDVLTANQLTAISDLSSLTAVSPGVQVAVVGNYASPYIRGVGTTVTNGRTVSPVPTNIDGVVVTESAASNPFYFDLARMEVLKGPQGTLYGRNATGGAVNLITNDATFGKYGGNLEVEVGDYALVHVTGAVNIPLGPRLAVRGSFQVDDHHGYVNDGSDDDKTSAGRLRLHYQPVDELDLHLTGEYGHEGGKGSGTVLDSTTGNSNPWTSNNVLFTPDPPYYTNGNIASDFSADRHIDNNIAAIRGQADWNLGFATLTLLPAFSHQLMTEVTGPTTWRYWEHEDNKQTTVEARLGHNSQALKWVVGGYYYNFGQTLDQGLQQCIASFTDCNSGQAYTQTNRSYAGFGEATYSLTNQLRLIAGARYTTEQISGKFSQFVVANPPLLPLPSNLVESPFNTINEHAFTWKLGAEYDVAPQSMLYFTASTGFKAGGVETITTGGEPYQPEKLTAYELGWKNRLLDNTVQLNADLFDWEYTDQQIGRLTLDPSGNPDFLTANAGASTIRGVDIDATWKFTPADQLRFEAEYAHGVYDKFPLTETSFGGPPVAAAACPTTQVNPINYVVDCSGKPLARLPAFSGTAGYRHDFDLGSNGSLTFDGNITFATSRWLTTDYTPNELAKGYTTADATLTYYPAVGNWSVALWGRNLADAAIYTSAQYITPTLVTASISPPRTFGIRFADSF